MEKNPPSTTSSRLLSYYKILFWDIRVQKFLSKIQIFFQLWTKRKNLNIEPLNQQQFCNCLDDKGCDGKLSKGDIKMVMDRLGIVYEPDRGNEVEERFGEDGLSVLFEEEPSLGEVKEAFDVFDENRDGFIDATELKRVLCCLGLQEGSEVEECRRMITAFDVNGDGLIDFSEFLKLMEKCSY